MSTTPDANCPRCGTALPARAPEGLCPRCLGALPLLDDTALTGAPPVPAPPPLTPAELAPHFPQLEILECLGRGGMGVVYKARQKSLNRLVALKLLAPERVTDAGFAERFTREAQALAALNHPSIVTIHDFGTTRAGDFQSPPTAQPQTPNSKPETPFYFLLMEFVDGVNLRQAMRAGRFTPEQALAIVPPVCEALQYAHEHGIVHRDIKPENLLLDKTGRIKIADFGIAKLVARHSDVESIASEPTSATVPPLPPNSTLESRATVAGTPHYMAPEQRDHHRTDHRADIYSLGVVLYELLTGELPAAQLQPPSRKVQIDVRLDEIVLRALETRPELRFQTAGEFRTQLETIATPASNQRAEAPSQTRNTEHETRKDNPPLVTSAAPPLLKTATAYTSTPEWLASARGQFWVYTGKGTLVLTGDQLAFTDEKTGALVTIPLAAIRDVSLGNYPWLAKSAPLHYLSVTWETAGQTHRRYFTPNRGWHLPVWETNPIVLDWHQALRAAVTAATGKAPTETPLAPHRPNVGDFAWMSLMFGLPLGLIIVVMSHLTRTIAPAPPPAPGTQFILSLLGFAAVVPFLTLYLLPRWGRKPSGPQPTAAPHKPPLWPTLALAAFCAPLLVHLLHLPTGQVPPPPTDEFGRLVFSFPGTLLLAALAGTGLWLRHRREDPPAAPGEPSGVASPKLAWVVVPVLVSAGLLLLISGASGGGFVLGVSELVILAVIGVLLVSQAFRRSTASPPARNSRGQNLLGVALICCGVFLGAMKFQESNGSHFQRVNALAAEIPRLQKQWHVAMRQLAEAREELNRFESRVPDRTSLGGRHPHVLEHQRLVSEVSKATVLGDSISAKIQTTTHTINSQSFPTTADFTFVLKWSLPFVLAGLVVLLWRGRHRADATALGSSPREEAPSTGFKYAGLLMLAMPVLLLGFLFLPFSGRVPSLLRPAPTVVITNVQHTVMGASNKVLFTELDFRVDGTDPVELRVEFTGPELPDPISRALAQESPDHGRLFASLRAREHNALLLEPAPTAAQQPRVHFQPGSHKWQIGFAFPLEKITWQARGNFRPPVTRLAPSANGEHAWEFFVVNSDNNATYRARLVARRSPFTEGGPPPVPPEPLPLTPANPQWVSVSGQSKLGAETMTLDWKVLASRPGKVRLLRGPIQDYVKALSPAANGQHEANVRIELHALGTNRVRMVTELRTATGHSKGTSELPGPFAEYAAGLARTAQFNSQAVRGAEIEICRVRWEALRVQVVESAPPPSRQPASFGMRRTGVSFVLIALAAVVFGFGGVASLVWLLRKGGTARKIVLGLVGAVVLFFVVAFAVLLVWRQISLSSKRNGHFIQMELHCDYPHHPNSHPPGRVQQTQNGFRLRLPHSQLATFELLLKQADDSLQPVPALTALVATSTNTVFHDRLYWTLRRSGQPETTNQLWFWSVTAHDGQGRALPQLTDHGTNFTHSLGHLETLDWWQLNLPANFTFAPGDEKLLPLFRTHGTATTTGQHPKEAWLRVRCTALPAGLKIPSGEPLVELGLTAHARLANALPATTDDALTNRPHN